MAKAIAANTVPAFFGEELFAQLRRIKAVFDPHNRMNPGKICTPWQSTDTLVSVDGQKRGYFDQQIPIQVRQSFEAATSCNGNGLCFNYEETRQCVRRAKSLRIVATVRKVALD